MSTYIRFIIIGLVTLFTIPSTAGAFEVPYQKIFQQRGSIMAVEVYGKTEPLSIQCDLDAWTCASHGTTTINLFPEFIEKQVILSKDQSLALVSEGYGVTQQYDLYTLGVGVATKIKTLDFSGETKKALFSDDNTKILFATTRGEFIVFDIATNIGIKSIPIVGGASFIRFSPHGNYIAYYAPSTLSGMDRTYTLVDVAQGHTYTWKEKNDYWDLLSEEEQVFDFSPDERYFLYLSDRDGTQTIYTTRLWLLDGINNGRLGKRTFTGNFTVNNLLFGNDGLLYATTNRSNPLIWSLDSYDFATQVLKEVASDVLYYPPPQRSGNHIVFVRSKNELPALHTFNTKTRVVTPLPTAVDETFLLAVGKIKNFSGTYGVLYTPDDYDAKKTYPMIVWLHGGPHRQTSPSFHSYHSYGIYDVLLENLRKNGFIVLKLDYRGSYGYGKKFATELKGNVGKLDVKDVITATTVLKKEMAIGEVYPMGTSYGGYLALRALADKPALFAGAISVNGVTDWWTLIKNDPDSIFKVHFNGAPSSKNKILYDQASIFLRLNNLKGKKIVLVNGEDDATIPAQQTTMLFDALAKKNIGATVISYEKEGHILSDSANLDDLCSRVMQLPEGYGGKTCVQ